MNPFISIGVSCIPSKYIFLLPRNTGITGVESSCKRFILAAHISWIREVISGNKLPPVFPTHDELSEDEIHAFLSQGNSSPLGPNWLFLHFTVLKVSGTGLKFYRDLDSLSSSIKKTNRRHGKLTWQQLVDFIGESSFNYLWEQPTLSFLSHSDDENDVFKNDGESSSLSVVKTTEKNYLLKLIKILYPNSSLLNRDEEDSKNGSISSVTPALSIQIFGGQDHENNTVFVFHPYVPHTLQDCIKFSPSKLANSHVKYMFILYQILQFICDIRDANIPVCNLNLADFRTDECLYLSIIPSLSSILASSEVSSDDFKSAKNKFAKADGSILKIVKQIVDFTRWGSGSIGQSLTADVISKIIRHWCEGLVSNYDYLMVLNFLSGRTCDGNPNFHPVFPWVTDFTVAPGSGGGQAGVRDLSKSKFRLNKGERQLDLMYDEAGDHNAVPHHVTDILSDITYYVYKARQTPQKILCRFVRPKWVPAEYPVSIQRMQEWTPDECIPEFYDDPNIFKSIHPDLADLQVPKWSNSPEDFIPQHRQLLESELTSAKIHHWIDLTFGYKLSGNAAVKSKNIYLSLADGHQQLEKSGIFQLFHTPHPPRRCRLRDLKNNVSYAELKKLRETELQEESTTSSDATTISTGTTIEGKSPTKSSSISSSGNSGTTTTVAAAAAAAAVWKNINLPKHFDPMGFLNDFEVSVNFFKSHFNEEPSVSLVGLKNRSEISESLKLFGNLLVELVLASSKFNTFLSNASTSVEERFEFYKRAIPSVIESVPLFAKRSIQAIFMPTTLEYTLPLEVNLDLFLLGDKLSPMPFPRYFPEVLKMVRTLRNFDGILQTAEPDDLGYRMKVQELKVKSFSRDLVSTLSWIDEDGLEIILPFVIELFHHPETRVLSVWNLFCPISRAIGRKKSIEQLLQPIVQIYESDYHSEKHLKLFHRSFLLQLMSCLGLEIFLDHFSTLLIEAIGGWKAPSSSDTTDGGPKARTHLNSTDILEMSPEKTHSSPSIQMAPKSRPVNRVDSEGVDSAAAGQAVEPEMFIFEPETSASDCEMDGNAIRNSRSPSMAGITLADNLSAKSLNMSDNEVDVVDGPPAVVMGKFYGGNFMTSSGAPSKCTASSDISEMCCESIIWLAHRLGPVLTAKYLTRNLLRMLTLCYYGHLDLNPGNSSCFSVEGDEYASRVMDCLIAISDLYGDAFIQRQYLPYAMDLIHSATIKKMSGSVEAAIVGLGSLLHKVFIHMPDSLLLTMLKEPLINSVLSPCVSFVCTDSPIFPSGTNPRLALAGKTVAMLNVIRKKIGPDLSQLHLKPLILHICATFQGVFAGQTDLPDMKVVFNAPLATEVYTNFCDMIVATEFETLLRDLYLKRRLEMSTPMLDVPSPTEKSAKKRVESHSNSFGSRSFGNRIAIQEPDTSLDPESLSELPQPRKDTTRHLKGNWLLYWDHEVGRYDMKFDFKQIKLQNFVGHAGAVRSIYVLNNENSFLTASKDKTVKLYSLRNQGDELTTASPQWTYSNHRKSVLSVIFNEPLHVAASTDGFIHVWDPFVGKTLRILDQKSTKGIICSLKNLENTFVGAGIDSTVHVVDPRSCHSYELKIGINQNSGLVRCMSVSPSRQYVSVGHSSGLISILDLRSGTLLGSWKAYEGEILQLLHYSDNRLISSSFDQHISVWNLDDNRLAFHMRGPTEPVHSICTYEKQLITCTTSNRIGVHTSIDPNSDFSSTRLRPDTFKGIVTTMTLLPLNQLLLVGSDSGIVTLLS